MHKYESITMWQATILYNFENICLSYKKYFRLEVKYITGHTHNQAWNFTILGARPLGLQLGIFGGGHKGHMSGHQGQS